MLFRPARNRPEHLPPRVPYSASRARRGKPRCFEYSNSGRILVSQLCAFSHSCLPHGIPKQNGYRASRSVDGTGSCMSCCAEQSESDALEFKIAHGPSFQVTSLRCRSWHGACHVDTRKVDSPRLPVDIHYEHPFPVAILCGVSCRQVLYFVSTRRLLVTVHARSYHRLVQIRE